MHSGTHKKEKHTQTHTHTILYTYLRPHLTAHMAEFMPGLTYIDRQSVFITSIPRDTQALISPDTLTPIHNKSFKHTSALKTKEYTEHSV